MKRRSIILRSAGILLLLLIAADIFRMIHRGCFLVLSPLLGIILAAIVSLLVLWLLWR